MKWFFKLALFPLALLRFVMLVVITIIYIGFLLIENKISKKSGRYKFITMRIWGKTVLFLLGFFVKRNKIPSLQKFLLAPNHRSYIDIFLMAAYSPSVFVAKAELKKWPIIGQASKASRMILVKRKEMKSLLYTLQAIRNSINNNIPVTIFPEGTTQKSPDLKPFKKGTFKIASELQIPVIPCAINYHNKNEEWLSKETFLIHFFRERWKPFTKVTVQFGEAIYDTNYLELSDKTKKSIEEMLTQINH